MLFIWLFFWWLEDFPKLSRWSNWTVGLIVCALIDFSHYHVFD